MNMWIDPENATQLSSLHIRLLRSLAVKELGSITSGKATPSVLMWFSASTWCKALAKGCSMFASYDVALCHDEQRGEITAFITNELAYCDLSLNTRVCLPF